MQGELVALEVPRGSGYDSQSGLNNLFPQVFGRLAAEGCDQQIGAFRHAAGTPLAPDSIFSARCGSVQFGRMK